MPGKVDNADAEVLVREGGREACFHGNCSILKERVGKFMIHVYHFNVISNIIQSQTTAAWSMLVIHTQGGAVYF